MVKFNYWSTQQKKTSASSSSALFAIDDQSPILTLHPPLLSFLRMLELLGKNCSKGSQWNKVYRDDQKCCLRLRELASATTKLLTTERMGWIAHRKWEEIKQEPGTSGQGNMLGCCLLSFHFLWAIHPIRPVQKVTQEMERFHLVYAAISWLSW